MSLANSAAWAGAIRYELPELIGNYVFDDGDPQSWRTSIPITTPFGYFSAAQATLVIKGTTTAGRAHGDGVIREAVPFELDPAIRSAPSFARSIQFSTQTTIGPFLINEVYANPFVPDTTPLPNPDGYPPQTFSVSILIGPSFDTHYPALIQPGLELFGANGTVIDVPITANVSEAYITFEGQGIAPEPSALTLVFLGGGCVLFVLRRTSIIAAAGRAFVVGPPIGQRGAPHGRRH
jgi:hypothetical protein